MLEVVVDEKGSIAITNKGDREARLWKVEVEYTSSLPGTLYTGEKSRRLRVKEGFKPDTVLQPGRTYVVKTGLARSSINTVRVYYQSGGRTIEKLELTINP